MNKNWTLIILLVFEGLFVTSCKKFLEEDLTTSPTASFYTSSAQGFENGINALYSHLRDIYPNDSHGGYGEGPSALSVFGTDTYTNGSDGNYKGVNQYDNRLNASLDILKNYWMSCYQGINQANEMIDLASVDIPGLSDNVKQIRIAEARFIRAVFYFNLIRIWGDVTLTLKPSVGVQVKAERTPAKEIYDTSIIPDLQFAIDNLPDNQDDYGRATKPAAQMLLSKVLLTRGYTDYAQPDDFSNAASLAEHVIHDYHFKLLDNYKDVFDINNQKNDEVVWSVQFTKNLLADGRGNVLHAFFLMEYDILPGMKRDIENGRPFKRYKPTNFLLGLWNRKLDVRWEDDFKRVFYCNNPSTAPEGVAVGDTDIYLPGHEVSQEFRDSKPYLIYTPKQYTRKIYPTLTKYLDPTRQTVSQEEGQRDFMVMRLADTYLIAAEAYFQMGDKEKAANALNTVRRRAAKPGKESTMEISPMDVSLDFILDERARELVGEMHRWFTLKRTHTLIRRVREHNPDAASNIQPYHRLRPIPQSQIDRVVGYEYKQNPGY